MSDLILRCAFTVQIAGTAVGCLMSYLMMEMITTEKMEILKAVEGSNIWSGQALQDHSVSFPYLIIARDSLLDTKLTGC